MYANAEQALKGLEDHRYKARPIMASKIVANKTRLIYYADELVGLKLHDTVIALYREDGITLDLRGPRSPNGEGWFTNLTLDRIDRFTPVQTQRHGGLTMIVANPGFWSPTRSEWRGRSEPRLYAHGCSRSSDGSFTNGMEPAIERHIVRLHSTWNRKAANFAKRCVTYWRRGGEPLDCCDGDGDADAHTVGHIEANEPCVPWCMNTVYQQARGMNLMGDDMAKAMSARLVQNFRALSATAIKTIEPNFPYPQPSRMEA